MISWLERPLWFAPRWAWILAVVCALLAGASYGWALSLAGAPILGWFAAARARRTPATLPDPLDVVQADAHRQSAAVDVELRAARSAEEHAQAAEERARAEHEAETVRTRRLTGEELARALDLTDERRRGR